ncbi:uncharacterized protein EI90DRAFT_1914262 [Cantharellus anzutake]|uniref:uncharacterized protein n=1 Tax=Cantharellus anzutake TaxID=1750568 RepID=UPI001908D487|nr:uncharacterized protein EI90DRAFT_1914262 [Cantharellus anzutake]KAF8326624.1 hypothetical protein EI90DRAFT_1914262 [Cantharellus anzutake]
MHSINYLVSHSNFGGPATPPENPAMRSLYPPQHRPSYPYYPYPHPETTLSPAPPPTLNLSSIPYPSRSSYFPRHDYSRCELPSRAGSMLHSSHNSARSRSVQPGSGHRSGGLMIRHH